MQDYTLGLNEPQKEAVLHKNGPLLIIAGAGAGKTKTLTHRILHLIQGGVPGNQILAVTFTNKAAQEMKERIHSLLQNDQNADYQKVPFIGTFHSLGIHILRNEHEILGIPRHFTVLDQTDSRNFIKDSVKAKSLDPKQFDPKKIQSIISKQKGQCMTAEAFYPISNTGYFPRIVAEIWLDYEKKARKEGAFDFDDLLLKTLMLLRDNQAVREKYQNIWQYIHIDEYQDTNTVQYELSRLLSGKERNICVVGDADQNIYSWRGANIKNILHFEKDYPGAKVVLLEENYRSTQNILSAANNVIQKNKIRVPKNLFTKSSGGEKISIYEAYDENNEASFIAEKIQELSKKGVSYQDIAILFRANYQSRAIEEAMLSADIPYQVLGVKFFERKEVKDVLSFLRASLNPDGAIDMKRIINVPPRGIGEVTLKKILAGETESLPASTKKKVYEFKALLGRIKETALKNKPSDTIKYILKEMGMENGLSLGGEEEQERIENLYELVTLATKYDMLPIEDGIQKLLEDAALASDQDSLMHKSDGVRVRLMTVHAAKGLEFETVFITGLEDGLFPHRSFGESGVSQEHKEEERRLFYVAITRAKKRLFLSYASVRTIFGSRNMTVPSEFLSDIPEELVEIEEGKTGEFGVGKIVYL
ncbi:MAG: UvrD-helicase domain-containing protein [Candidatus Parcubacteria bacterium]|nr:UvrD-helicase domain-containing protein [Candidatus Parcubacteria bacterium]